MQNQRHHRDGAVMQNSSWGPGGRPLRVAASFNIFEKDAGLFQLRREKVTVVGIAGKGPGAHDQVALERAGHAHLDTELVGLASLAL